MWGACGVWTSTGPPVCTRSVLFTHVGSIGVRRHLIVSRANMGSSVSAAELQCQRGAWTIHQKSV